MTKHTETTFTFMEVLPAITARLMVLRPIAVLPLIVGGLLALGSDAAYAQRCFMCDDEDCTEDIVRFGYSACWMGEGPAGDLCLPGEGSELCEADEEEGGWALSPTEEALANQAVLAMVRNGRMLPADTRYFVAVRGDKRVVRKKCGGSLVGIVVAHGTAEDVPAVPGRGRAT